MTVARRSGLSYEQARLLAEIAERDLKRRIADALRSLGDPNLVRARFDETRIKELDSLRRKARRNGWNEADAIRNATDLVGLRIVCNNLQDVRRAVDLIKASFKADGINTSEQDYITSPGKRGYRAIHLDVRVPTGLHNDRLDVGCEVQVRSLLQDAWARLSHADVYGSNIEIAERMLRRLERLSEQLAGADGKADIIRNEMAKPRSGRKPAKGAKLNPQSVAFLYRRAFNEDPPAYLVDLALNEFSDAEFRTDALDQVLSDQHLVGRLKAAYQSYMPYPPSSEELFTWVVRSLAQTPTAALRQARLAGKQAWEEVDQIYRREALRELPDTIDELLTSLESTDGEASIESLADAMRATSKCSICGATITNAESLAEAVVDHYDLKDPEATEVSERIEAAVRDSGVEVGDWDDPSLCAYHGHQVSKDD
jgi:ppGpp synthetase/RelA/SpoT-type nucleotidyltranferase